MPWHKPLSVLPVVPDRRAPHAIRLRAIGVSVVQVVAQQQKTGLRPQRVLPAGISTTVAAKVPLATVAVVVVVRTVLTISLQAVRVVLLTKVGQPVVRAVPVVRAAVVVAAVVVVMPVGISARRPRRPPSLMHMSAA